MAPGVDKSRPGMLPVPLAIALCRDLKALTKRVLAIRAALPSDIDVALLFEADPQVLLEEPESVAAHVEALQLLFPTATGRDGVPGVDRMVRKTPQLLDSAFARATVKALAPAYKGDEARAAEAVHRDPSTALMVESQVGPIATMGELHMQAVTINSPRRVKIFGLGTSQQLRPGSVASPERRNTSRRNV